MWKSPHFRTEVNGKYLSKSDALTLLEMETREGLDKIEQAGYGTCESCGELSENLKWNENKWICETCGEDPEVEK